MKKPEDFTLARYAPYRRWVEVGGLVAICLANALANSVTALLDVRRAGLAIASWEPVVWEWTSSLVLLALVPEVLAFERRFPLQRGSWSRSLRWHAGASVVFSMAHVLGMVGLRHLAYALGDAHYDFGDWTREFGYEYLKDVRTYVAMLLVIYFYRLLLLRLQGEARLLDAPDDAPPPERPDWPERFLVRKLGREFLIAARDIEWIQASGNYVNLHVRGREYPLRSTIAGVEERLDPALFQRVHRSYILNLDQLVAIEPLDSGEARLHLRDGAELPCSRRYRGALRNKGSGLASLHLGN